MLDEDVDEVAALRRHHERLLAEADRLLRLADTVERTIHDREEGTEMAAEELFDGFRNDPHAAEARERYGEAAVEAQRRTAGWDAATAGRIKDEGDTIHREMAEEMRAGTPVDDAAVQELVARHHAWVCHFWTPNRDAYTGLGRQYVDDERLAAAIDATAPGLAAYLCEAMAEYARTRLA